MENSKTINVLKFNNLFVYGNQENIIFTNKFNEFPFADDNKELLKKMKNKVNILSFKPKQNINKENFIDNIIYSLLILKKHRHSKEYESIKNYIYQNILNNYKTNDFFHFINSISHNQNINDIEADFFVNKGSDFKNFKEEMLLLFNKFKYFKTTVFIEKNKKFLGKEAKFYLVFDNRYYCIYNTWFPFKKSKKRKLLFKTDNLKTLYWYLTNFHY
tara:strand:+ start:7146 stop:7793 length:648 start_codon:yes stop_codon:yes gene_type:complete